MAETKSVSIVAGHPLTTTLGGAERQAWMLARELARRNWRVEYLDYLTSREASQSPETFLDGVHVRWINHGISKLRYLRSIQYARRLLNALNEADSRIVLQTVAGRQTGIAGYQCERKTRPFVYRAAQSIDADLEFKAGFRHLRRSTKLLYKYGISKASAVVANAQYIVDQFKENPPRFFRRNVRFEVIRNGVPIPPEETTRKEHFILFAARLVEPKRPELFVKLAEALPEYRFVMCGSGSLESFVRDRAGTLSNLKFEGFVKENDMTGYYRQASLFVNTSSFEGFPNSLLHSGIHYTPYISFVDPDDIICRYGIGVHVTNFEQLAQSVKKLMENEGRRMEMGRRIRQYVVRYHSLGEMVNRYELLFEQLLAETNRRI